ncbi:MAG TPA: IPT/TIG domain-containing protein [Candidatus Acidoferrales bacterium]|nr:IPT/TIG domain-containing protein [Candidatus Acidoferrales bacterium]
MRRLGWAALMAAVVLFCGCGNSSYNPTPAITGLFPPSITAGSQSFTLYLSGNGFQSNTTAQWNGVDRPVVFDNQTGQLAMTILAGDVANLGNGQITVANPAPGGGLNPAAVSFVIRPPAANGPTITSLNPSTAVSGSHSDITLNVAGSGLSASYVIAFNGTALNTSASGSPVTQLTATIGSESLASVSLASIAVQTDAPGVASPSVKFPIGPASNPVPKLTSLKPSSTAIGTLPPGALVILTGTGFVPGSVVNFNGSPRPTGYSSSTTLAVGVQASDVATGGTISVTVSNPNPGGGASSSVNFMVQ